MSKKTAMIIVSGVICIIALLVGYGFYLNFSSENNIAHQIEFGSDRRLQGVAAWETYVSMDMDYHNFRLEAAAMEDAVAKGSGNVVAVYVKEHQRVKKGQPLMQLDATGLKLQLAEAEENLARAQTNVERYRVTLDRYDRLLEMDAISAEKRDDAKANFLGSSAEARAAERRIAQLQQQIDDQLVCAPVDGEVLNVYKHSGSYVTQGTALALVGDFSRLYIKSFDTDEAVRTLLHGVQEGLYLTIPIEGNGFERASHVYGAQYAPANQGQDQHFALRLEQITPGMEQAAQYRNFIFSIDNSSGILEPRNYTNVTIKTEHGHNGLVVPKVAVHGDMNSGYWVYIWNEKHELETRPLVPNMTDGDIMEILSGLRAGEIVIITDPYRLHEGMKVQVDVLDGGVF